MRYRRVSATAVPYLVLTFEGAEVEKVPHSLPVTWSVHDQAFTMPDQPALLSRLEEALALPYGPAVQRQRSTRARAERAQSYLASHPCSWRQGTLPTTDVGRRVRRAIRRSMLHYIALQEVA